MTKPQASSVSPVKFDDFFLWYILSNFRQGELCEGDAKPQKFRGENLGCALHKNFEDPSSTNSASNLYNAIGEFPDAY